ncbi:hypothetical protein NE237_009160 [Protea cynaroides]|uniref:Uncharacterized protein n=1 Tax=Protea cynaroides TaxID=273540 RepID=A0A9Q0KX77_9MAGN|nr:hypothetical protein NE237_009160 [Protea cynaroides]
MSEEGKSRGFVGGLPLPVWFPPLLLLTTLRTIKPCQLPGNSQTWLSSKRKENFMKLAELRYHRTYFLFCQVTFGEPQMPLPGTLEWKLLLVSERVTGKSIVGLHKILL